ncbi:MAG: SPOR domain-containing protein [Breznakibacter sp.]|nr:SPOR domain-containing protein [Breznakibacter sp.]
MKQTIFYLFVLASLTVITSCSSLNKGSSSFGDKPATKAPSSVKVKEAPVEKPAAKEVVVKQEKVKIIETQANEKAGKFYVIIGSFKVLDNARNFRQQLVAEKFAPSILENENGLYRVSVASYDDESMARTRIADIRSQYEKYGDVWLLVRML